MVIALWLPPLCGDEDRRASQLRGSLGSADSAHSAPAERRSADPSIVDGSRLMDEQQGANSPTSEPQTAFTEFRAVMLGSQPLGQALVRVARRPAPSPPEIAPPAHCRTEFQRPARTRLSPPTHSARVRVFAVATLNAAELAPGGESG